VLAELLEYCLTPCPPAARRLGYLREAVAIRARALRCRTAWSPHLERCKAFILAATQRCARRETALVIGSGALLDIPLAELSARFRKVILADIVHPLSARWRARRFSNVRLVTVDVTGLLHRLPALSPLPPLAPVDPGQLFLDHAPDFTLSANVLSQLPLLPLTWLEHTGRHSPAELERTARAILQGHLDWLQRLPGTVGLITDVEWRIGEQAVSPLHGLEESLERSLEPGPESRGQAAAPGGAWTWSIAPRPEAYPDKDVVHLVRAGLVRAPGSSS